jgi:hypothetical protein
MESNEANKLATYVSSAEYSIVNYLKEHPDCTSKELMPHVIDCMSIKANKKGEIERNPQPIHTLAFLIAFKELDAEGVIKIDRGSVPFPMTDFKSIFSLVKPKP